MPSPVILDSIDVSLGGFKVLDDVALMMEPGEVVGVVGANGTGKTTLVKVIASLISPTSGDGSVLGARLGSSEVYTVRSQIGLISHAPTIIPELTLAENVDHIIRLSGGDRGRISGALRVVGLDGASDRVAINSSFGMLRRTEVARLLITEPDVLLLDEAYSGLDIDAAGLIDALISRTTARAGATVIVSHERAHMDRADRVFALSRGRLEVAR